MGISKRDMEMMQLERKRRRREISYNGSRNNWKLEESIIAEYTREIRVTFHDRVFKLKYLIKIAGLTTLTEFK